MDINFEFKIVNQFLISKLIGLLVIIMFINVIYIIFGQFALFDFLLLNILIFSLLVLYDFIYCKYYFDYLKHSKSIRLKIDDYENIIVEYNGDLLIYKQSDVVRVRYVKDFKNLISGLMDFEYVTITFKDNYLVLITSVMVNDLDDLIECFPEEKIIRINRSPAYINTELDVRSLNYTEHG